MFKLIGMIVAVAVLVIGYPALSRWFSGEATPKEAVQDVRNRLGSALLKDGNIDAPPQQQQAAQPAAAPAAPAAPAENPREPMSANQMIKNMMKD